MRGHFLRVLERAAVGEIGGNAGGAERMRPSPRSSNIWAALE
jgi:hypothetical protein